MKKQKVLGVIPARSGSERIKDKNIFKIGGHPLIGIAAIEAQRSDIFSKICLCTDSKNYAEIGSEYGLDIPALRPVDISGSTSPDIEWVNWVISIYLEQNEVFDVLVILRPTSPFRTAVTIKRAWEQFQSFENFDSLRAVEEVSQHPGKMWVVNEKFNNMTPLLPFEESGTPWHSLQKKSLPKMFVQNACLEIVKIESVMKTNTISGLSIMPFFTTPKEGFDINDQNDLDRLHLFTEEDD